MKTITDPELTSDINQILKEVGSRIRAKRRIAFKNYEDFAHIHKLNKVTVARIETGSNSSLKAIIMVSRALGIPLEELFKGIH